MISFLTVCEEQNIFVETLIQSIKIHVPANIEYEHLIYLYPTLQAVSGSSTLHDINYQSNKIKIFTGLNIGFGSANNYLAKESKFEILYLINPDAFLEKFDMNEIISLLSPNSILSVEQLVSRKKIYWKKLQNTNLDDDLSTEVRFNGLSCDLFFNSHSRRRHILYADGAGLIISKCAFMSIEGFDEDFFLFGEDMELCIRHLSAGGLIKELSQNSIVHYSGGSLMGGSVSEKFHQTSQFRRYATEFNSLQIAFKHLEFYYLIPWIILWILYVLILSILAVIFAKTDYLTFYYKAIFFVFRRYRSIYWRRRKNFKLKTRNSIFLLKYVRFVPSILVIIFKVGFPKIH